MSVKSMPISKLDHRRIMDAATYSTQLNSPSNILHSLEMNTRSTQIEWRLAWPCLQVRQAEELRAAAAAEAARRAAAGEAEVRNQGIALQHDSLFSAITTGACPHSNLPQALQDKSERRN